MRLWQTEIIDKGKKKKVLTPRGFLALGIMIVLAVYAKITNDLKPFVAFMAILLVTTIMGTINEILGSLRGE